MVNMSILIITSVLLTAVATQYGGERLPVGQVNKEETTNSPKEEVVVPDFNHKPKKSEPSVYSEPIKIKKASNYASYFNETESSNSMEESDEYSDDGISYFEPNADKTYTTSEVLKPRNIGKILDYFFYDDDSDEDKKKKCKNGKKCSNIQSTNKMEVTYCPIECFEKDPCNKKNCKDKCTPECNRSPSNGDICYSICVEIP